MPGYTERRELGSGASGRVVLAVHEDTGTPVAVKYLSEALLVDGGFLHAFREEARLLGELRSPHVVALYEYVESPLGAAIVMEAVDGVALRALLRREGPTGPEAALAVLKGSLLGLAAAHRAGVVHRDYKPANVLVAADGTSKLADFGIATRDGTASGSSGTPLYMAPEQWNGSPASPATDVYAATATFYECLTGQAPYPGENLAELAVRHISAPVPAERVPEPVRGLVRSGLAKDPGRRPHDAAAFVAELEAVAGAAYGEDWEERGQRRLAALAAALLPLLLPSAQGGSASVADLATTALGGAGRGLRSGPRGLLTAAGVLVLAGALTVTAVASGGGDGEGTATARTRATTTAVPGGSGGPSGAPPGPAAPSASHHAPSSAPPSPSPSATGDGPADTTTDGATNGATDGAAPGSPSAAPDGTGTTAGASGAQTPEGASAPPGGPSSSAPPTAGPDTGEPSPPVRVRAVSAAGPTQTGPTGATATVRVTTTGTGPVTLTVTWDAGDTRGVPGTRDGAVRTYTLSGETAYSISVEHTFTGRGCYWGVGASTDPAPAGGSAWQQVLTRQCELR